MTHLHMNNPFKQKQSNFYNNVHINANNLFEENNNDNQIEQHFANEVEDNDIFRTFFSKENINRIQKMIKKEVFLKTKGEFKLDVNQDETDLIVAMRAIYYEYAKFQKCNIIRQVKELNKLTVNNIVPDMITEIKQEYEYIKEINEPIKPIARPTNLNTGKQILPSMTTTW